MADAEFNPRNFLEDGDCLPCIVTNPPFSLAFEFCQHAVSHSRHVFLLLRLNFLASKKRAEWFRDNEPSALFVLTKRPSFTEGGTDSCDYAWFYWVTRFVASTTYERMGFRYHDPAARRFQEGAAQEI